MEFIYQKMYLHLFNRVTDALRELAEGNAAEAGQILRHAQCECEDLYMDTPTEEDKP